MFCYRCSGWRQNPDTSHLEWMPYDILADSTRIPVITYSLPANTPLYHATARDSSPTHPHMWFYFDAEPCINFIVHEAPEDASQRLYSFTTLHPINKLVFIPSANRSYDKQQYISATQWLRQKFGASFNGLGYMRLPDAEQAICDAGYDGLYLESDDSYNASVMLCDPNKLHLTDISTLRQNPNREEINHDYNLLLKGQLSLAEFTNKHGLDPKPRLHGPISKTLGRIAFPSDHYDCMHHATRAIDRIYGVNRWVADSETQLSIEDAKPGDLVHYNPGWFSHFAVVVDPRRKLVESCWGVDGYVFQHHIDQHTFADNEYLIYPTRSF